MVGSKENCHCPVKGPEILLVLLSLPGTQGCLKKRQYIYKTMKPALRETTPFARQTWSFKTDCLLTEGIYTDYEEL